MNRRVLASLSVLGLASSLVTTASCVGSDAAGSSDGGGESSAPEGAMDAGPPKRVFVSSKAYGATFGGSAGADRACNDLARAANVSGTFKAWLSVGTRGAASRIVWQGGYRRGDGLTVVSSRAELLGGKLQNAISVDESGRAVPSPYDVWTNTDAAGEPAEIGYDCTGFTETLPGDGGSSSSPGGSATATDARWTVSSTTALPCSGEARLYCFEE